MKNINDCASKKEMEAELIMLEKMAVVANTQLATAKARCGMKKKSVKKKSVQLGIPDIAVQKREASGVVVKVAEALERKVEQLEIEKQRWREKRQAGSQENSKRCAEITAYAQKQYTAYLKEGKHKKAARAAAMEDVGKKYKKDDDTPVKRGRSWQYDHLK